MAARAARPVVLVTGASQGIGAAISRTFAREVPRVRLALVARNGAGLRKVAAACARAGAQAEVFPCDVTDEAAVASLEASVRSRFGRVDVLVNNAGQFFSAPFASMAVADFDRIVAANLRSAFLVSRAFVPAMIRQGGGDLFLMSSIAGRAAFPGGAAYSAAKFGVAGLAQAMRADLRAQGIRVCCVYPGATSTPSWDGSGVSEKRMMPAEDVARAFLDAYRMSRRTVVEEIVLRPILGDV